MKKDVIAISLLIIILLAGVLVLLGLRPRDLFVPSYRFLDGRNPITYREPRGDKILYKQQLYIYSFEADFNDVCTNIETELIPEGFADRSMPSKRSHERHYMLERKPPLRPIIIMIHDNCGYIQKDEKFGPRDGWIMVEIISWRKRWRWPF